LCLNGNVHTIYHLVHTMVLTYLVHRTHIQSIVIQLTTIDDRDITDCLRNLPWFLFRKKKEGRPTKHRKCSETTLSHIYDSTVEQCYLNLPEDMVEDNPLDLENIKERQDHDEKLMQ
jgi:hypothetical protein